MKNKKAIIYSTIMLLFIAGLIIFKFNNKTSSSLVENVEKSASVLNDNSLGNWTIANEWVNLNSKSNVVINRDEAVINATKNIVTENEITYRINLSYEGGTAQSDFGNEYNDEGIITSCQFVGGCQGNTKGISQLVVGMKAKDVIDKLSGIPCRGSRTGDTSCPDQLAKGLKEIL